MYAARAHVKYLLLRMNNKVCGTGKLALSTRYSSLLSVLFDP